MARKVGSSGTSGTQGCPHGLTLLNSTGLKMSMRSEKSFWMLLRRWVSMGALGTVTRDSKVLKKAREEGTGTQGLSGDTGMGMQGQSEEAGMAWGHDRGT